MSSKIELVYHLLALCLLGNRLLSSCVSCYCIQYTVQLHPFKYHLNLCNKSQRFTTHIDRHKPHSYMLSQFSMGYVVLHWVFFGKWMFFSFINTFLLFNYLLFKGSKVVLKHKLALEFGCLNFNLKTNNNNLTATTQLNWDFLLH